MGLRPRGAASPYKFSNNHFRAKNQVINYLIFVQAIEKIFGQDSSAPLNETRPVYTLMIGAFYFKYFFYYFF